MWQYVRALDTEDADAHAAAFTPDGQFGTGQNTPPRVAAAGRQVDDLVRVSGQWLIKLRDVAPKD